jgi:hypothetical protein
MWVKRVPKASLTIKVRREKELRIRQMHFRRLDSLFAYVYVLMMCRLRKNESPEAGLVCMYVYTYSCCRTTYTKHVHTYITYIRAHIHTQRTRGAREKSKDLPLTKAPQTDSDSENTASPDKVINTRTGASSSPYINSESENTKIIPFDQLQRGRIPASPSQSKAFPNANLNDVQGTPGSNHHKNQVGSRQTKTASEPADKKLGIGEFDQNVQSGVNQVIRNSYSGTNAQKPNTGVDSDRNNNSINQSESEWNCSQCSNVNWSFRTVCNRCQTPRNGNSVLQSPNAPFDHPPQEFNKARTHHVGIAVYSNSRHVVGQNTGPVSPGMHSGDDRSVLPKFSSPAIPRDYKRCFACVCLCVCVSVCLCVCVSVCLCAYIRGYAVSEPSCHTCTRTCLRAYIHTYTHASDMLRYTPARAKS